MTTLTHPITRYVNARRQRGEISRSTAADLRSRLDGLDRSFGDRPLGQLGTKAIEAWLGSIGQHAPATRRAYRSTANLFCEYLVREKMIKANPVTDTPRVREGRTVPRGFRQEDVAAVLAVCPDARARAILWLLVGCGLRCVEVARLGGADYDPVALTLFVKGKSSHERIVPVPVVVARALDRYIAERGRRSGPLVASYANGGSLTRGHVSYLVACWCREAGVHTAAWDGRTAHAFRHTCATDVLDGCNDLRIVQAMLGHHTLAASARYVGVAALPKVRAAMEGREYRNAA